MKKCIVVLYFMGLIFVSQTQDASDVSQDLVIINYIKRWFDDIKSYVEISTHQFDERLRKATLIHYNYDEDLMKYKEESLNKVKEWMSLNCAKCEWEEYDDVSAEFCYNNDEYLREQNYLFYSYMSCVYKIILDYKNLNRELEKYFTAVNEIQENILNDENVYTEEELENVLEEASKWLEYLTQVRSMQNLLLNNLSEKTIENGNYVDKYNRVWIKPMHVQRFSVACYKNNSYTDLSYESFKSFQKCIVQKTCNNIVWNQYNT